MGLSLRGSLAVGIALLIGLSPSAYGGSVFWTGADGNASWSDANNWSTGTAPDASSGVSIGFGSVAYDVTNPAFSSSPLASTINSLLVGGGAQLTLSPTAPVTSLAVSSGSVVLGPFAMAGTIALNSGTALQLGSTAGSASIIGNGMVFLNSGSSLSGLTGTENLNIQATVAGAGTVGNFQSVTNGAAGMLWATGGTLTVNNDGTGLTNWNAAESMLSGGAYQADSTLLLKSLGGDTINTLSGAAVTVNSGGLITGDGVTNALAGLTNITDSTLNVSGQSMTLAPAGGTLSLGTSMQNAQLAISGAGATLAVQGNISNIGGASTSSVLLASGGGTLTASGLNNGTAVGALGTVIVADATSTADFSGGLFGSLAADGTLSGHYATAGNLLYSGGEIGSIAAGSSVEIDGAGFIGPKGSPTGTLALLTTNNGTLTLNQDGAGTAATVALSGKLTQNGTLNVLGTNTVFSASGLNNSGQIVVGAGATADFSSGSFDQLTSGTLSGGLYQIDGNFKYNPAQGPVSTIGSGTVVQIDGAGQINGLSGIPSLTANSGALILTQNAGFSLNAGLTQSGGSLILSSAGLTIGGSFTQDAGSSLTLQSANLNAQGLNNAGTIVIDPNSTANFHGGAFANLTGGTLGGGGSYLIAGSLVYDGGEINTIASGTSVAIEGNGFIGPVSSSNPVLSQLSANNGTLTLDQDINANAASITLAGNFQQSGTLKINNGSSLTVSGQFIQTAGAGTFILNGGGFTTNLSAQGLSNAGMLTIGSNSTADFSAGNGAFTNLHPDGTLTGGGTYQVAGTMIYYGAGQGISAIGSGTTVEIDGSGQIVESASGANAIAGLAKNSGTLIVGDDDLGFSGSLAITGDLEQAGTVQIVGGSGLTVSGQLTSDIGSTTDVGSGSTLEADGGITNNGTLAGTGTIYGNVVNDGVDNPGGTPDGIGTQTVMGTYEQMAAGMLVIDVAGDPFNDTLNVLGNVTLDPGTTLEFNFVGGFVPSAGEEFTVLTWGDGYTLTGNFDHVEFALPGGLQYEEIVGADSIAFDVVAPEPSTMALSLMLAGCTALIARRRGAIR